MDSSYRQIIKRILKEERMGEDTLVKLLNWYESWTNKTTSYVAEQKYAEIIGTHFKVGLGLFSAMKSMLKHHPEYREQLSSKFETLRSKLLTIQDARKSFDKLK